MKKLRKRAAFIGVGITVLVVVLLIWKREYLLNSFSALRVQHVDLIHNPENRLRFELKIETTRKSDVYVKYWVKNSTDTLYTRVSKNERNHTLWFTNTVANTKYRFQAVASNPFSSVNGKEHPLETKIIYQATPYFSLEYMDENFASEIHNKFFLTQILTEPGSAVIIDHQGNIVWYEAFSKGAKVTNWTTDNTVLCILGAESIPFSGGDEIVEIDLSGEVLTRLEVGKGDMDKNVHHEVRLDDQGNIYAITFDKKEMDLSALGGSVKDTVNGDGIVVFTRAGKKIWEWSVLDHLDLLTEERILERKKDLVHANAVFKQKDGDFLISYRDLNQIWKIDHRTGEVIWRFGEGGDFEIKDSDFFSGQHNAHINENNKLMILDNGTEKHISRGLSFSLNEKAMKASAKINITLPKDYISTAKGSAHLFNKNSVLFSLTDARSFIITDLSGKFLWRVGVGGDPYRVEVANGFLNDKPVPHGK